MKTIIIFCFLFMVSCEQTLIDGIAEKQNKNMIYPIVILEKSYNGRFYQYRVEDSVHNVYYIGKIKDQYNVGETIRKP